MTDPKAALLAVGGEATSASSTLPNIPAVPNTDNYALNNILASVKLWIEKAGDSGVTGFATKHDLAKAGLISMDPLGNVTYKADLNLTTPPVPTGLHVTGAMTNILLDWDNPATPYSNHAYTEIWAAETSSFTEAVLVGESSGMVFAHAVGEDSTRYYWIRFVSTSGVKGPFNSVNGTLGQTAKDPAFLMSVLTEEYGYGSAAPFFQVDAPITINGVTVPAGTYMKSAYIHDASITNAKIGEAAIDSAKIADAAVVTAKIADASITDAKFSGLISSSNYNPGSAGWAINRNGAAEFNTGIFRGQLQGATGVFAGTLAAGVFDVSALSAVTRAYNTAGTFTVTVPNRPDWTAVSMRVTLQGAGGGGQEGWGNGGNGGAGAGGSAGSRLVVTLNNVTPGATYELIVGAGGLGGGDASNTAARPGGTSYDGQAGMDGGSTTFSGYTVLGGKGGAKWLGFGIFKTATGKTCLLNSSGDGDTSVNPGYSGQSSQVGNGGLGALVGAASNSQGYVWADVNGENGGPGAGGGGGAASNWNPNDSQTHGGKGGDGSAMVEFYDPNFVVTGARYNNLIAWLDGLGHGSVPTNAR